MSSLLPLFVGLPSGTKANGGGGFAAEPLGQVIQGQAQPIGHTVPQAFSQVLREHEESSGFFTRLPTFVSIRTQPDAAEKTLSESQADRIQAPEVSVLPTSDSDVLPDPASLPSQTLLNVLFVGTNEFAPERVQVAAPQQPPFPVAVPTTVLTPLDGLQTPARPLLQGRGFQPTGGNPTLGPVRQDPAIEANFSGKAQPKVLESGTVSRQGSLRKVPASGFVSQPVPQGSAVKHASLVLNPEEPSAVRTFTPPVRDVPSGVQQVGRSVYEDETLKFPILQRLSSPLTRSPNVRPHHIPPVTAIRAEGPAGFAEPGITRQFSITPISGRSSVLNDVFAPVIEHRTTVSADLLGESGLLGKGERAQTIVETSIKSVGLDPSGGQGLGSGMNHSPNSQSGFQQPSSFPGHGVGLRALEERGSELPAPALQRLQMDVQLSENQRVQIDVGVQNRQVYAGLVMDHSVLRNLAAQFVPQLENQLTEVDLELQEFSAEVREEREQDADALWHDSRFLEPHEAAARSQGEAHSTQNPLKQYEERGLHLVA